MSSDSDMPLTGHLEELRTRLVRASIAVFVLSIASYMFSEALFAFLTEPLRANFEKPMLIGTGVAEGFIVKLKVALAGGFVFAAPYCFYELWKFVAPGLYENERSLALPFVAASSFFFFVGISFCFYVVLPFAFQFFEEQFMSIEVTPTIRIGEYLSFVTKLLMVFGAVFELPVLTFFLARIGLISSAFLIEKARISVVLIFVVAAILTPPDVATQVLLAVPLIVLYGLCILIAKTVEKPREPSA
ncbi:MAG: twin-arginine translocase subunit TatC [Bdellovibrionales bacterium]|nr:twin-arginine translocase subunit TatC [Bdellovibrionales bacterium]